MTTMPLAPIVERSKPSKAPLFRRLLAAASEDAADAARDFCLDVIAATLYSPPAVQRKAGTVFLLLLDALNDKRSEASRERRWRRFITVLDGLAAQTQNRALLRLSAENADLK